MSVAADPGPLTIGASDHFVFHGSLTIGNAR